MNHIMPILVPVKRSKMWKKSLNSNLIFQVFIKRAWRKNKNSSFGH